MSLPKPKTNELRSILENFVSASIATRISALATALQWYDNAVPFLISKKLTDPEKLKLMNKATKCREIGISTNHLEEKETAFKQSIQILEKVCEALNPPLLSKYVDEYKASKAKLEADEQRLSLKYQPVLDLLATVFKSTGFNVKLDPQATKARSYDGSKAIVYNRAALKEVLIKLRSEGLMPVVLSEIMFFSRAKAFVEDAGAFVYKPELQVKALQTLMNEFVEYARQDDTKWKLLRYGTPRAVIAPTAQTNTTVQTPKAPRVGGVGNKKKPGERYVPGSAMGLLYDRLKSGKPIEKKDLFKDLPTSNPEDRLKWILRHGKEKGEWELKINGNQVQMIMKTL